VKNLSAVPFAIAGGIFALSLAASPPARKPVEPGCPVSAMTPIPAAARRHARPSRAISKTAVNGEINCIDPGGFGAVTVTKSITIDCH